MGTVSPVFGDRLVSVTYSKPGGRQLLQSWIPLLALLAHDPGRDWAAVCICRPRKGTTPQQSTLRRPAEPAVDLLADLVAMYDEGRRAPTAAADQDVISRGRRPYTPTAIRSGRRGTSGSPTAIPVTMRSLRTCATWGQGAWLKVLIDAGLDHYAGRLWLPMLRAMDALMDNFDLLGPLPEARSTTVLEASAGTGKTFALAGLVTRYIAEGEATLDQMLLITFGRAATQELRDRVRAPNRRRGSGFRRSVLGRRQPGDRASARLRRGRTS